MIIKTVAETKSELIDNPITGPTTLSTQQVTSNTSFPYSRIQKHRKFRGIS